MQRFLLLVVAALFLPSVGFAAAAPAAPTKDNVTIDQKNYRLVGIPVSNASQRTAKLLIQVQAKVTLASQEKSFLRAAINLDGPESFRPVFAQEIVRGTKAHEIDLEIVSPKQKIIRVVVWIDKEGDTGLPKPIASDNIAFDGKRFAN